MCPDTPAAPAHRDIAGGIGHLQTRKELLMKRQFAKSIGLLVVGLALVIANPASADPIGGRQDTESRVAGESAKTYVVRCWGNEPTRLVLRGDGDTVLGLFVYDLNG